MDVRRILSYDDAIDLIIKLEMNSNRMNSNYSDFIIPAFKRYFQEEFLDKNGVLIGMYDNNKLIGLIGNKNNYIEYLYVEKEYQHLGIGSSLLNLIDKSSDLYLDSSDEAHLFYQRYGFIDNGEPKQFKKFKTYPMVYKNK